MDVFFWILQVLLALIFLASGLAKISMSRQHLLDSGQTGIALYPMPVVRFTAACEIAAAAGLIFPWALGTARVLTPLAALGLCVVMVGAASAHLRLRERRSAALNAVLFLLALAVAIGRLAALG